MHVNLLPHEFVAQKALRRAQATWLIAICASVLCGAGLCAAKYSQVAALRRCVAEDASRTADRQQVVAEIAQWERELLDAQADGAASKQSRSDKRVLALIGMIARSTRLAGGTVRVQHVNIRMPSPSSAGTAVDEARPGPPPGDQQRGALVCEGVADDAGTISRLIAALREAGAFTHVELKGSRENPSAPVKTRQFRVECQF